jgi:hypothetical protein
VQYYIEKIFYFSIIEYHFLHDSSIVSGLRQFSSLSRSQINPSMSYYFSQLCNTSLPLGVTALCLQLHCLLRNSLYIVWEMASFDKFSNLCHRYNFAQVMYPLVSVFYLFQKFLKAPPFRLCAQSLFEPQVFFPRSNSGSVADMGLDFS